MANMTEVITKEEIKETNTIDLALRMDFLLSVHENEMEEGEGISMVVCDELVEIDKELKRRLHKVLGKDIEETEEIFPLRHILKKPEGG